MLDAFESGEHTTELSFPDAAERQLFYWVCGQVGPRRASLGPVIVQFWKEVHNETYPTFEAGLLGRSNAQGAGITPTTLAVWAHGNGGAAQKTVARVFHWRAHTAGVATRELFIEFLRCCEEYPFGPLDIGLADVHQATRLGLLRSGT